MNAPDRYQRPLLRYKRLGGGFRREDVEFALAELRLAIRKLDSDLTSLRNRNRELERELDAARAQIESFHGREHDLSGTISDALRRAADIEAAANAHAREITAQAEETAMRIRSDANRRVESSSAQFNELLRLKDDLFDAMRGVVGDFDQAISRVERAEHVFRDELHELSGEETLLPPASDTVSIPAPPSRAPAPHEVVFGTRVELDAGPFPDFATLSAFERSLEHVPGVGEIHVHRIAHERALIELTLVEPGALLQTMAESLPYRLEVRAADRSKLVVDVVAQARAAL